jgi:hypothetical protein
MEEKLDLVSTCLHMIIIKMMEIDGIKILIFLKMISTINGFSYIKDSVEKKWNLSD